MLKYTICFIRRGEEVLMLNRERPSWMGCWNGIGGKLEPGEQPRASMIRELSEETGIEAYELHFKGMVTWSSSEWPFGGMYAYVAEVSADMPYPTPVKTDEGILDWKKIGWILDEQNVGVASNVPKVLLAMLRDPSCYDHHCVYEGDRLVSYAPRIVRPELEFDDAARDAYFAAYAALQGTPK
ncbi:NUDIX hydrolase [Paenibacillus arenilitoris]|uniref:8-oxo-dGTP diphosphatase n=1 Tax=Paenibacillus arenilitoris TaxID=2772299 RepID=A0A927CPI4_9BACL|nr:8-oxo-dGTP diphosphatase [Paenibacillus arenilitoris]MBD2871140.1 8-oxo-dGTP diphosphatase [Paenibacillus arenilitoris]